METTYALELLHQLSRLDVGNEGLLVQCRNEPSSVSAEDGLTTSVDGRVGLGCPEAAVRERGSAFLAPEMKRSCGPANRVDRAQLSIMAPSVLKYHCDELRVAREGW